MNKKEEIDKFIAGPSQIKRKKRKRSLGFEEGTIIIMSDRRYIVKNGSMRRLQK